VGRVIVDSNVWSVFFRRDRQAADDRVVRLSLRDMLVAREALIIGPVRQEVLTGLRDPDRFLRVREGLRGVEDVTLISYDYERAAEISNVLRAGGVASTPVDALLCAVAERVTVPIFTLDQDFERYSTVLGIELHRP
jgi:predicted nucleic acid-binding protein